MSGEKAVGERLGAKKGLEIKQCLQRMVGILPEALTPQAGQVPSSKVETDKVL